MQSKQIYFSETLECIPKRLIFMPPSISYTDHSSQPLSTTDCFRSQNTWHILTKSFSWICQVEVQLVCSTPSKRWTNNFRGWVCELAYWWFQISQETGEIGEEGCKTFYPLPEFPCELKQNLVANYLARKQVTTFDVVLIVPSVLRIVMFFQCFIETLKGY